MTPQPCIVIRHRALSLFIDSRQRCALVATAPKPLPSADSKTIYPPSSVVYRPTGFGNTPKVEIGFAVPQQCYSLLANDGLHWIKSPDSPPELASETDLLALERLCNVSRDRIYAAMRAAFQREHGRATLVTLKWLEAPRGLTYEDIQSETRSRLGMSYREEYLKSYQEGTGTSRIMAVNQIAERHKLGTLEAIRLLESMRAWDQRDKRAKLKANKNN